jgi:hypothetical protein
MKRWLWTLAILAIGLALASAQTASAASAGLTRIASHGVSAALGSDGIRTAFGFARGDIVIAGTAASASVRLTTAGGTSDVGTPVSRDQNLAAIHAGGLGLGPLREARPRQIHGGSLAYVLGPPLGYEAQRIRSIRLPAIRRGGDLLTSVRGKLPAAFQGAPVVTGSGLLIGAVAQTSADHWMMAPLARIRALATRARRSDDGGGLPVLPALGCVLALSLLGAGIGFLWRRRRRASAQEAELALQATRAQPIRRPSQPLVRLRSPAPDHESAPDPAEDFQVVLKSREDDS